MKTKTVHCVLDSPLQIGTQWSPRGIRCNGERDVHTSITLGQVQCKGKGDTIHCTKGRGKWTCKPDDKLQHINCVDEMGYSVAQKKLSFSREALRKY